MYLLLESTQQNTIGNYPQLNLDPERYVVGSNKISDFFKMKGLRGSRVRAMKTALRTKLTDYMSSSATFFPYQQIISQELLNIYCSFKGQPFEVGNVDIARRKKMAKFNVVNFLNQDIYSNAIDFSKSRVGLFNWNSEAFRLVKCDTLEEYKSIPKFSGERKVIKNLYFSDKAIENLHYLIVPELRMMFISDEMAARIVEANITGYDLRRVKPGADVSDGNISKLPKLF